MLSGSEIVLLASVVLEFTGCGRATTSGYIPLQGRSFSFL